MRPAHLAATALALLHAACGYGAVSAEGSFGAVKFAATGTVFAVIDAHREVANAGGGRSVEERVDKSVLLFFCEPNIDPEVDFAAMSGAEIIDLQETVRRGDRLFLSALPLAKLTAGSHLESSSGASDFAFTLRQGVAIVAAGATYADERPLGRLAKATLVVGEVRLEEGGSLAGAITVALDRAGDQPANTATGAVTLRFTAPVVHERLGESNLAVLGYP